MQKVKPWRSAKYRKWIASRPCCICRYPHYNEAHHHQFDGQGIMAGKVSDSQCVPLCQSHHFEFHRIGKKSFAKKYKWDAESIIKYYNERWQQLTGKLPGVTP